MYCALIWIVHVHPVDFAVSVQIDQIQRCTSLVLIHSTTTRKNAMKFTDAGSFNLIFLMFSCSLAISSSYECIDRQKNYCVIENVVPESNFPSEKSLMIQNSTIENFGERIFRALPAVVENLMIHNLSIVELHIVGCDRLGMLFASYNNISQVSAASGLPLGTLHLYQNRLKDVTGLAELANLEQLYLHDNLLEVLEMDTFRRMKNLKILTLHRNFLTAIDTKQSIELPSLESLFLQHNDLSYLDTGLWKMPALKTLDLSSNNLFTFLEEFPSLKALEMHDNRWNCAWLFKMLDRKELRSIQLSHVDRTCEGRTLFQEICCLAEGASPDPMMLLISRTGIVDDLQDRLGAQVEKVQQLEESHRKQTHRYDEMKKKVDRLMQICKDEL
ncbi:protein phosphatase 1 regulatory subunit pprA-like [Uranotaenia lowii]|uniref:protein phosphatase 1 regulatory subunit pprA-like n=1 Tax=Uranotaenia lowii TaxID=190385 RepID=UPI0024789E6A|nr:protein phosphatase 1 regulatory subunit pprA-like [Uranotaenia lowii]